MSMGSTTLSPNKRGVCAFCRHWYDVTNSHINPKNPKNNLWEYDRNAKCKCMIYNSDRSGYMSCPKYECKVQLY